MTDRGLSVREAEIAALAARGATNAEIAHELGVAERTVEWNLTRVYRKLGVRSKVELAAHVAGTPWAERPIVETDNASDSSGLEGRGGSA